MRDVLAFVQDDTSDAVLVGVFLSGAKYPLGEPRFGDRLAYGKDDIGLGAGLACPLGGGEAILMAGVDVLLDEDVERDEDKGGLAILAL